MPPDLFHGPAFVIGPAGICAFLSVHRPADGTAVRDPAYEPPYLVWSVAAGIDRYAADPVP